MKPRVKRKQVENQKSPEASLSCNLGIRFYIYEVYILFSIKNIQKVKFSF